MSDLFRPMALLRGAAPRAPKKDYESWRARGKRGRTSGMTVVETHSSLQDGDDVSLDIGESLAGGGNTHVTNKGRLSDDTTSETGIVSEKDDTISKESIVSLNLVRVAYVCARACRPMTEVGSLTPCTQQTRGRRLGSFACNLQRSSLDRRHKSLHRDRCGGRRLDWPKCPGTP